MQLRLIKIIVGAGSFQLRIGSMRDVNKVIIDQIIQGKGGDAGRRVCEGGAGEGAGGE